MGDNNRRNRRIELMLEGRLLVVLEVNSSLIKNVLGV